MSNFLLLLIAHFTKGGLIMLAMMMANRIILGKMTYSQVPAKLKDQVAEILRDNGCEYLIVED